MTAREHRPTHPYPPDTMLGAMAELRSALRDLGRAMLGRWWR